MTFLFKNNGLVTSLQSPVLEGCHFIRHAFCTRHGGISDAPFDSLNVSLHVGDNKENVLHNRSIIADAFQMDAHRLLIVDQVHGDKILVADESVDRTKSVESATFDAMVTNQPNLALGIKTADCVPIFLVDETKKVIGAVHAGWQGTALRIAAKTIDVLISQFKSRPEDILAVIGPAIGPCCYEVDSRIYDAMAHERNRRHLFAKSSKNAEKWMFDLSLANKLQVISMGILEKNIFEARVCTACRTDLFFSHRGEKGKTGRQLNFVMLNK